MNERIHGLFTGSVRGFRFQTGRTPLAGLLTILLAMAVVALALLLIVPLILIAAVGGLAMFAANRTRALLARMRAPNGALDGRRNVKVIVRD